MENPMVRIGKQQERRNTSPRKNKSPVAKTGVLQDNLPNGYKQHENAIEGDFASKAFIPKIRKR